MALSKSTIFQTNIIPFKNSKIYLSHLFRSILFNFYLLTIKSPIKFSHFQFKLRNICAVKSHKKDVIKHLHDRAKAQCFNDTLLHRPSNCQTLLNIARQFPFSSSEITSLDAKKKRLYIFGVNDLIYRFANCYLCQHKPPRREQKSQSSTASCRFYLWAADGA
jgi:hypothetical protein